jgi:hypothetical protein
MEVETMTLLGTEPALDSGALLSAVVVHNDMDVQFRPHLSARRANGRFFDLLMPSSSGLAKATRAARIVRRNKPNDCATGHILARPQDDAALASQFLRCAGCPSQTSYCCF